MTFSNIPNDRAKGYPGILTNSDNVSGGKYSPRSDSDSILSVLDLTWCGAQLPNSSNIGSNLSINTTEELLTLINDMNKRIYALTAAVIALSNK